MAKYKVIKARFEVAKHGGATGSTGLCFIPKNMVISRITVSQATALAPVGSGNSKAGIHINNTLISATGATAGTKSLWATGTTFIVPPSSMRKKFTTVRKLKITKESGPHTAGAYDIYIEGVLD